MEINIKYEDESKNEHLTLRSFQMKKIAMISTSKRANKGIFILPIIILSIFTMEIK